MTGNSVLTSWDRIRRPLPYPKPLVTVVIHATNAPWQLECLLKGIEREGYEALEIVVKGTRAHRKKLDELATLGFDLRFVPLDTDEPRGISDNAAAASARATIIGLMSDDLEPRSAGWLAELVSLALVPDFGAVGGKIVGPDDALRSSGYILSPDEIILPLHGHRPFWGEGYFGRLNLTRSVSALSGACLFLRKSLFDAVNGFDSKLRDFADIDLCLKISATGYQNLWTPFAEFRSHETLRRHGWWHNKRPERDVDIMKPRWAAKLVEDRHYNPNLSRKKEETFRLAFPPRAPKSWQRGMEGGA